MVDKGKRGEGQGLPDVTWQLLRRCRQIWNVSSLSSRFLWSVSIFFEVIRDKTVTVKLSLEVPQLHRASLTITINCHSHYLAHYNYSKWHLHTDGKLDIILKVLSLIIVKTMTMDNRWYTDMCAFHSKNHTFTGHHITYSLCQNNDCNALAFTDV